MNYDLQIRFRRGQRANHKSKRVNHKSTSAILREDFPIFPALSTTNTR